MRLIAIFQPGQTQSSQQSANGMANDEHPDIEEQSDLGLLCFFPNTLDHYIIKIYFTLA